MAFEYTYPRAALTVDAVIFGRDPDDEHVSVLLIQRNRDPFAGSWALPGGFLDLHETLEAAALRELFEETGIRLPSLEQLRVFDAVNRDPRERVISVVHGAVVVRAEHVPVAGDDAGAASWFPLNALPSLAFDHAEVVAFASARLLT